MGRCPLKDHMAAIDPGTGPHVHHVVGGEDGVFVMLHHQHRIAHVPHIHERTQQSFVIPLMKADAGFVKYIEHTGQFRTDLGGQPDSLALSTGQGVGRPVQGQIAQAHIIQKCQARGNLLDDFFGNHAALTVRLVGAEKVLQIGDGSRRQIANGLSINLYMPTLPAQP